MLQNLACQLAACDSLKDKIIMLQSYPEVSRFLGKKTRLRNFIQKVPEVQQLILLQLIAAGQGFLLKGFSKKKTSTLFHQLLPLEKFYAPLGGIVGYQSSIQKLLCKQKPIEEGLSYQKMHGVDLKEETFSIRKAIFNGIEMMDQLAEIYPVGGAADRLQLYDSATGFALPAARLSFLGKTLLEGLIIDLQSREYLHYKLFQKQLVTPIALMTSEEKNNHQQIFKICEEAKWFGRFPENFKFFCQPLVPAINSEGKWCTQISCQIILKPGGHGMIWRLAHEEGIFDWFLSLNRKKALIRQINNPIANTDYGLFAFTGIGLQYNKRFGFASCPRQIDSSEGMNVLIEKILTPTNGSLQFSYTLTNIEYCDFSQFHLTDNPQNPDSIYSQFPSNTNILFADLQSVIEASKQSPLPGMLINLKKNHIPLQQETARLESTMQNIADCFTQTFDAPLSSDRHQDLQTFLTYNYRLKTISAIKHWSSEGSLLETPEQCFLDILMNNQTLLKEKCCFSVPDLVPGSYQNRFPFIFLYHPALGPLYSIISQKIQRGTLEYGSELQLQIAEIHIDSLTVKGSLLIHAEDIMGSLLDNYLHYSETCGRCYLKNVTIDNQGINPNLPNHYWSNQINRHEVCQIILKGMSEFYAQDITLKGNYLIEVPDGYRCYADSTQGEVQFRYEKIHQPTWYWKLSVDENYQFLLQKHLSDNLGVR